MTSSSSWRHALLLSTGGSLAGLARDLTIGVRLHLQRMPFLSLHLHLPLSAGDEERLWNTLTAARLPPDLSAYRIYTLRGDWRYFAEGFLPQLTRRSCQLSSLQGR